MESITITPEKGDARAFRKIIHVLMSVRPCDYGTDQYHADVVRRYLEAITCKPKK
ncbi:hypothetical protein M0R72_19190 [Candidatus Pacearchaeota archaeon]|jgi:hypothetical protein|nr:hypothetical protein [Candidatus Pacearchaeota archaeon]